MTNLLILTASIVFMTRNTPTQSSISDNLNDTTEITFACLMDTGDVLSYFDYIYPDQSGVHLKCIIYNNGEFSDTGFNLKEDKIIELDKHEYVREFFHYSRFFKRHELVYLKRKYKRKFKGFRFKIFNKKLVYSKDEISYTRSYLWPANDKYLRITKYGYIIENIKILE